MKEEKKTDNTLEKPRKALKRTKKVEKSIILFKYYAEILFEREIPSSELNEQIARFFIKIPGKYPNPRAAKTAYLNQCKQIAEKQCKEYRVEYMGTLNTLEWEKRVRQLTNNRENYETITCKTRAQYL